MLLFDSCSLQISSNGNVELVFEYDSDWSDLADDEDPDSNDERFEGNDYPEEGEGTCCVRTVQSLRLFRDFLVSFLRFSWSPGPLLCCNICGID